MNSVILQNDKINISLKLNQIQENVNDRIIVSGEIFGAFHNDKVLNKNDLLNCIVASLDKLDPDLGQLKELLKDSVGSFQIIFRLQNASKDEIHIFTSPRTTGCFATVSNGTLSIYNNERNALKEAYGQHGYNADDIDLIDVLFSRWISIAPDKTLSKNVYRIPGAMHTVINANAISEIQHIHNWLSIHCYYLQTEEESINKLIFDNEDRAYELFKKQIEGTMAVYASTGKPIKILFSGGMDSCTLAIAAKKQNIDAQLIATNQTGVAGTYDSIGIDTIQKRVASLIGLPSEYIKPDRFSEELREFRNRVVLPNIFENATWWDSWIIPSVIMKYQNDPKHIFLTGQYMDTGYGVGHTKDGTILDFEHFVAETRWNAQNKKPRWFKALKAYLRRRLPYFRVRLTYSPLYLKGLTNDSFIGKQFVKWNLKKQDSAKEFSKSYEYVLSPLINGFAEFFTTLVRKSFLPEAVADFRSIYLVRKQKSLMERFFGSDICEKLQKDKLDYRFINHLFRTSILFIGLSNDSRYYDCHSNMTQHNVSPLPLEGPMQNFWLNYMVGPEHVKYPKLFLYRYFKEHTGKDYLPLRWEAIREGKLEEPKAIELPEFMKKPVKAKINSFEYMLSKTEVLDVLNNYYSEKPVITKLVEDGSPLKARLEEMLENFEAGVPDLTYKQFMKFYNIEMYLRSIRNELVTRSENNVS